jgi:hypothetical protein
MEFLRSWVYDHILTLDTEIGKHLAGHPLPSDWQGKPVFSEGSGTVFKHCTLCGKEWPTYEDFIRDESGPCRYKCACRYTNQILSELDYRIH